MARKCSYCGQEGHNILKCPDKTEAEKRQYLKEAKKATVNFFLKSGGTGVIIGSIFNAAVLEFGKFVYQWLFGEKANWLDIFDILIATLLMINPLLSFLFGFIIGIIGTYLFMKQESRERVYFFLQKLIEWVGELPDSIFSFFCKKQNKNNEETNNP